MAKKPTAAQRKVLEAMRDGAELCFCQPLNGQHWQLFNVPPMGATVRVNTGTCDSLQRNGWIKFGGSSLQGGERRALLTLTESGLSALKQSTP